MDILIVDDDIVDQMAIKRTLLNSMHDYHIQEADSAESALQLLNQTAFDVILLDYNLPCMNGIELVIKFRGNEKINHSAIIMLSNSDSEQLLVDCVNAGAQDFILKSELSSADINRALIQAKKRFELEHQIYNSYMQVKYMAEKDSLTGLSNRYHFDQSLKQAIKNNARGQSNVAIMLLDLDHFKYINDSFGHDVGDQLLIEVSKRIKGELRQGQVCARLGGG